MRWLDTLYRRLFPRADDTPVPSKSQATALIEANWDLPLEEFFVRLIAERDGVPPEDVTVEYIHRQREEKLYPTTRFDISSEYGGYDLTGLRVLTRAELDQLDRETAAKTDRLLASAP